VDHRAAVTAAFEIDPRLAADTIDVAALPLCRVRLMNDRRYPWAILVPARHGAREIIDLDAADRARLMDEIALVSTALRDLFQPLKLNVAALGNVVAQLHVHVVARFADDAAWPRPIWGTPAEPYAGDEGERCAAALRDRLVSRSGS
jgi:diadenosine tetraphosphate (Ap4A) HIT family hydrolase